QAARSLGVDVDSVCGGRGLCGRCQVDINEGRFAKFGVTSDPSHLSEAGAVELRYAEKRGLKEGRRLSCSAMIEGDVVVDVPETSQVHRQMIRKRAEARVIEIDPVVRLHYVEVRQPDMHDPTGDLQRLYQALEEQWDIRNLRIDRPALQSLQKKLRAGNWNVTTAVRNGRELIHVWPGFRDRAFGLAIDVGSTTIAAHLTDLTSGDVVAAVGEMNPQIRFGEDLMSRVSYVMMNPGGDATLTAVVREALNDLAQEAASEAGIELEDIVEMTLVGNPIMHHLVLGIDPTELGGAPFALATDSSLTLWAAEIGVTVNPGCRVHFLPCIAGHVGADCAAVILSESPHLTDVITLIVDVGTNAEIVLGNRNRLLACSSPTGPAFEGAQISCGQRAAPGAIERVRIDPATLEPRYRVIGSEIWSDEVGFADETRKSGVTGICGSGIIEVIAEMFLAGIVNEDGVIDGSKAAMSPRIVADGRTFSYVLRHGAPELRITQNDIRAIQLAKAALYAGARLLMDRLEIDEVDRVVLAGAFVSHIDPKYAMILGMIPDCEVDNIASAGNAAGTGARIALLNRASRAEIADIVRGVEKVETAVEPRFQEHFIGAMAIPHKTAPYAKLARQVSLPVKSANGGESIDRNSAGRRRRRQRNQVVTGEPDA
ncbi:MAG: ASKHA domain-containing protein, partial [Rhodospirillales bacterium]